MCVSKRNWPPSSVCRVLIVCAYDHVTYRQLQLHLVSGDKSYCTASPGRDIFRYKVYFLLSAYCFCSIAKLRLGVEPSL